MINKIFKVINKMEHERHVSLDLESKPFSVTLKAIEKNDDSIFIANDEIKVGGNSKELFDYFEVGKEYCLDLYKKEENE